MLKETISRKANCVTPVCETVCWSVWMVAWVNHFCGSVLVTWGQQASPLWPGDDSNSGLWSRRGKTRYKTQRYTHSQTLYERTCIYMNPQQASAQRNTFHTNLAPWDCERLWSVLSGRGKELEGTKRDWERGRHFDFQCPLINKVTSITSTHTQCTTHTMQYSHTHLLHSPNCNPSIQKPKKKETPAAIYLVMFLESQNPEDSQ